jgi:hypothetical protein
MPPARLAGIQAGLLKGDPDPLARAVGVAGHVDPRHLGLTGGDREQRREHAHGRRLAGPVGTQEAEDLAGVDLQVHAAHGLHRALPAVVVLHKPFGPYGRAR